MTTWPFVPTRPVILDEYNDLEARYGAFGPPVSVRERIPIRHKITEAETAPGLVGGFRYVPPQFLVPDWPAPAQFTPPSAQRPVTQLHDGLEREQDCLRLDQRSVPVSDWPGRSQRSQLITIVSTTTPTGRALVMPQPTPPGTLSSPLLGRHRRRGAREVAANERGEEPRRGDRPSARAHLAARQPTQPECRAASRRPSLNAGGVFILTRARLPLPPGPAAGRGRRWPGPKLCPSSPIDSPSARSASMNWRGQPLTGHEVVVNLIAGTTTRTGLTVHAELDNTVYPKGIKITDRELRDLETQHLVFHAVAPAWSERVAITVVIPSSTRSELEGRRPGCARPPVSRAAAPERPCGRPRGSSPPCRRAR